MARPTFVIAEVASCHDGDWAKMGQAIQVAKEAGADAIKFQWCSSPARLAERRHAQEYESAYHAIVFPRSWLKRLRALCTQAKIEFMCTVYLPEDIPVIAPLVKRFKVASFEAGDLAFLQAHERYGKPILVSTGMLTERQFYDDVETPIYVNPDGRPRSERFLYDWLYCVSGYPTPPDDLNLCALNSSTSFHGFSDHSGLPLTGAIAVALGASILEVHFRLPTTDPTNPDYPHSLPPEGLAEYIANVRLAERMLGDGEKKVRPSERRWMKYRVRA